MEDKFRSLIKQDAEDKTIALDVSYSSALPSLGPGRDIYFAIGNMVPSRYDDEVRNFEVDVTCTLSAKDARAVAEHILELLKEI